MCGILSLLEQRGPDERWILLVRQSHEASFINTLKKISKSSLPVNLPDPYIALACFPFFFFKTILPMQRSVVSEDGGG